MKKLFIVSLLCSVGFIGSSYAQSHSISVHTDPSGEFVEQLLGLSVSVISHIDLTVDAVIYTPGSGAGAGISTTWGFLTANAYTYYPYDNKFLSLSGSGSGGVSMAVWAQGDAWAEASFLIY